MIGLLLRLGRFEELFLRDAALMPQAVQLPGIDAVARGFKALLQNARQRQVHVVAAQQDVVPNGDAFQRQFAVLFGNHNEAEIRGAAADVAHQHQVADLDSAAPVITLAFQPRVKGGLRLFQQRDLLITGLFGGAPGQLACLFVERSGHREQHVLFRKRDSRCSPASPLSHTVRKYCKNCDDASTGDSLGTSSGACQGKIGAVAVHRSVREPGFGGGDQAVWTLRAAFARQFADHELRLGFPWQGEAALGKIEFARDVEKRRQQRAFRHFVRIHKLRNAADLDAAFLFGSSRRRSAPAPNLWSPDRCRQCIWPPTKSPLQTHICCADVDQPL